MCKIDIVYDHVSNPHTRNVFERAHLNSAKLVVSQSFLNEKNFVSLIIDHSALSMTPVATLTCTLFPVVQLL